MRLAREVLSASPTHPAVFTSANEGAVGAFLEGRLPFLSIFEVVARVVGEHHGRSHPYLAQLEETLQWATVRARELIENE